MDRREFIQLGTVGAAGLALGGSNLTWLADKAMAASQSGTPWKFGVMADTQWKSANTDGLNPAGVSVDIIGKINKRMVEHGVKFVLQVGDLVDAETDAVNGQPTVRTLPTRAAAAKLLYDNGIGFFPVRGNHESSQVAANEVPTLFPQTTGGSNVFGAANFSSPSDALKGLSYSFDFGNVRFVLVDQFVRRDGTGVGNIDANTNAIDQLPWVDTRLSGRDVKNTHAFVFSHKNLIGQNHVDTLFGENPAANASARNDFIKSLAKNGVRYQMGGHDHMHHRSIVTSPDGAASVQQIICASNSYKFYTPAAIANDVAFDNPVRERVASHELWTIGYYIFTVDGPRVTIDYYSSTNGIDYAIDGAANRALSDLKVAAQGTRFYKRETWGYSLNGKAFTVAQGEKYTGIRDDYQGTVAKILAGANGGTQTDIVGRKLVKTVNTGWTARTDKHDDLASEVLSLWGLEDSLAMYSDYGFQPSGDCSNHTDTYVLSMTVDPQRYHRDRARNGQLGIASKNADATWSNAADKNAGGSKQFVLGRYKPSHKLGTYGFDASTRTCWAVLNYQGDFAVSRAL